MWSSSSRATEGFVGEGRKLELRRAAALAPRGPRRSACSPSRGWARARWCAGSPAPLELQTPTAGARGACDERESMPFRGIDGALDSLARVLSQADPEWVNGCMPEDAGLLGQFFPVLSQVRAVAMAQRPEPGADPVQVRLRLFEALRRLLANLALKGPLVLVLEDLQWAGGDTWALLSHLFRAAVAEMLVVFTVRVDESGVDGCCSGGWPSWRRSR
ncbi:MAG: ATP-binding protein [Archangiaceae bacterium]|nr:ATP-binding protein [Archangiaceae bacterium]